MSDLAADAALARAIAADAGMLLRSLQADGLPDRGSRGDAAANDLILTRLRSARPGDFILSEEAVDDRARCSARRVWIVDPLDGTREFAEGRDDWAVHVGLAIDGRPAAGAVAVPGRDWLFDSAGGAPLPMATDSRRLRIVVSRSRLSPQVAKLVDTLDGDVRLVGSAGVKAMMVVTGEADAYLHTGGQMEWDNCAPVAVALAAGCHASRIDGTPLTYNCAAPHVPDLLICRPQVRERILFAQAAGNA